MTPPNLSHYVHIPTGFDLELDPLIAQSQVAVNALQKPINRGLDAEAHTYGYVRACSSDPRSMKSAAV